VAFSLNDQLPSLAFGVVNVAFDSDDRDRAGDEFFYSVLSHDLGWFRIHGGCGTQDGEALPFFGVDKTFRTRGRKPTAVSASGKAPVGKSPPMETGDRGGRELFTLRADAIRTVDHDWIYSAGVLVPVCRFFVMEAWGNFPDNGDDASLTLKANIVFTF
jgi:hypothetical protein